MRCALHAAAQRASGQRSMHGKCGSRPVAEILVARVLQASDHEQGLVLGSETGRILTERQILTAMG
jgi:hypothetical protein